MPRARMGALPFPGPFTLFKEADPTDLGTHSYGRDGKSGERSRGIFYTCNAGFFDLSHVRNTADMTAYIHARVDLALSRGWTRMRFRAHEPSVYEVSFTYPPAWRELSPDERSDLVDDVSVPIAQHLALIVMTWHELLTWHGYKSTVVFPENASAFTYEDITSHALGAVRR